MSEPDDLDLDEEEGEAVDPEGEWDENEHDDEAFFDTQSAQSSQGKGGRSASDRGNNSEDVDTEDGPVGPITPGPGSRFEFVDWTELDMAKPRLKQREGDPGLMKGMGDKEG